MTKLVVVLDLDGTLFDHTMDSVEWIGSKTLWVEACKELQSFAAQHGVTIYFAIATAKNRVDDLAAAAAAELHPFLLCKDAKTNEYRSIFVKANGKIKRDSFIAYHETEKHLLIAEIYGDKTLSEYDPHIQSSFQIDIQDSLKINMLQNIARLFEVDDRSRITLIDDTQEVLDAVSAEGFSVISCNHFLLELNNRKRALLAKTFVSALVERMKKTILSMAASLAQDSTDTDDEIVDGDVDEAVTGSRASATTPAQILSIEGIFNGMHIDPSLKRTSELGEREAVNIYGY